MRIFNLVLVLSMAFYGCKSNNVCRANKNYFVRVNESKPYKIESKYCVVKGSSSNQDKTSIELNIYDRISQNTITEALIWINNNEKLVYSKTNNEIILDEGIYDINIVTPNNLPLKIKELKLTKNQTIEINGYLGNSLQF